MPRVSNITKLIAFVLVVVLTLALVTVLANRADSEPGDWCGVSSSNFYYDTDYKHIGGTSDMLISLMWEDEANGRGKQPDACITVSNFDEPEFGGGTGPSVDVYYKFFTTARGAVSPWTLMNPWYPFGNFDSIDEETVNILFDPPDGHYGWVKIQLRRSDGAVRTATCWTEEDGNTSCS